MKLGIFAKTFPGREAADVLGAAQHAGFEAVQYNMACSGLLPMPDKIDRGLATGIAYVARRLGLEISAVSGTFNMIHPDPAVRERGFHRLEVLAGAAHAMGTRLITLCTGTRDAEDQWRFHPDNASPAAWRDMLGGMERAIAIADAHDVDLGIEPETANVVASAEHARRLLDTLPSPRLKIVLDPANLFEAAEAGRQAEIVAGAVDLLADRIVMAHAKDRDIDGNVVPAGRGLVDFPHFFGRLKGVGFAGAVIAHGLEAYQASSVAAYLAGAMSRAA